MRTQKRFTPKLLDRYLRQGRGTGTYANYIPWHRVSRSDPSSSGRSHLILWRDRQRELLSDGEWGGLNFAALLPNIDDLAEQFPLSEENTAHELSRWDLRRPVQVHPGTVAIAKSLGIKHPTVREKEETRLWTGTTDLLLILRSVRGYLEMVAVSCKPGAFEDLSKRAKELLKLEKLYWEARGIRWLLITPKEFDRSVALTLRRTAPWGLAEAAPEEDLVLACRTATAMWMHSETALVAHLTEQFDGEDRHYLAQRALWQSIWQGRIAVDLRRGWRPHQPFKFITTEAFISQNPIAAGRTAWK